MKHKHIDPQPDHRYIIMTVEGDYKSAVVINQTNNFVLLAWDFSEIKQWYSFYAFQIDACGDYPDLCIMEEIEHEQRIRPLPL